MSSNLNMKVPTQQSVKHYVDSFVGGVDFVPENAKQIDYPVIIPLDQQMVVVGNELIIEDTLIIEGTLIIILDQTFIGETNEVQSIIVIDLNKQLVILDEIIIENELIINGSLILEL